MASLQIPKSAYTAVQALVRLTASQYDELIARLEETPPTVDADKFIGSASSRPKELDSVTVKLIISELLAMMDSGYRADFKATELASEISSAALEANSEEFPFTAEQKKLFELRLSRPLARKDFGSPERPNPFFTTRIRHSLMLAFSPIYGRFIMSQVTKSWQQW